MIINFNGQTSSNVLGLRYNRETKTLEAAFKGNRIYHYFGVPESTIIQLQDRILKGESIGKTFNELVLSQDIDYAEVDYNG